MIAFDYKIVTNSENLAQGIQLTPSLNISVRQLFRLESIPDCHHFTEPYQTRPL